MSYSSILIFNEDVEYQEKIAGILKHAQYQVIPCYGQAEVVQRLREEAFDLLILDICPSKNEGYDFLKAVRGVAASVPILIITVNPCLETAIEAIRYRVLDYLSAPIKQKDLLERIKIILEETQVEANRQAILSQMLTLLGSFRTPVNGSEILTERSMSDASAQQTGQYGEYTVNPVTREVIYEDKHFILSPTEFNYWLVLLRHEPEVVTHRMLVKEAQGYELKGFEAMNMARWHIHGLRQTLKSELGKDPIATIRGVGYCIIL